MLKFADQWWKCSDSHVETEFSRANSSREVKIRADALEKETKTKWHLKEVSKVIEWKHTVSYSFITDS